MTMPSVARRVPLREQLANWLALLALLALGIVWPASDPPPTAWHGTPRADLTVASLPARVPPAAASRAL